jgi:TorA maturation chaperone TorD
MNSGQTIFAQSMDLLPLAEFRRCADRYRGDYKVESFSCLDRFLSLAFAQLAYCQSLRDIETCLRAHQSLLYHMGVRGAIARNTLANANQQCDWRIDADFARLLIAQVRALY